MEKNIKEYNPSPLQTLITTDEVTKATRSMKNGCGKDGIYIEYIKYAPTELHKEIANILYSIQSEEPPPEIVTGLLSALQKPGKKVGPPGNL